MRSPEQARPTCSPSPGSSCRRSLSHFCSSFASSAYLDGRLIVIVGLTMFGYAMLVGLAPSVVRSTVMTTTFCSAAIAQRLARPANTLSLAALLTLGINPMYLFDVGCQLSFLAIGALVWLVSPACALVRHILETIRRRFFGPRSALDDLERLFEPWWRKAMRRVGTRVVDGVVASTVVWLAALPLVAFRFHLVSPIGILLNIPLIPITSAAMLLGGLSLVLSAAWGPLGGPLAWAAAWLLRLTQTVVLWGVAQPLGSPLRRRPGLGMGAGLLRDTRPGGPCRDEDGPTSGARPGRLVQPQRRLVAPGSLDRARLVARRRRGGRRHAGGRIPGGRARSGGLDPHARWSDSPLRLRPPG